METDMQVLQFRIVLEDIEPPIWRRIQVPSWYSLWDLHVAIQDAMGWLDYHLHAFRFPAEEWRDYAFGIPIDDVSPDDDVVRTEAGWLQAADTFFRAPGDRAEYAYDFGDDWRHDIVLEAIVPAENTAQYPRCLDGARACPPEDCGGLPGYEEVVEAFAHPEEEESAELITWATSEITRYPPFSPERFDSAEVRFDDPDLRWRNAFGVEQVKGLTMPPRDANRRPLTLPLLSREEEELEEILDALRFFSGEYEYEAVDAAIARRDEIVPSLVEVLEDTLHHPEDVADDEDYFGHTYALMLAGHLRVEEAHGVVAALAALPNDLPHRLFDDSITTDFPAVLLRTCAGNFDTILRLAADPEADIWGRSSAIDALAYGVALGMYPPEDAKRFLSGLLDGYATDDDPFIASHCAYRIIGLHPAGFSDRIERAINDGLIDPTYFNREDLAEGMEKDADECLAHLRDEWSRCSLDDIHASMEWWACFDEHGKLPALLTTPIVRRRTKKKKQRRKQSAQSKNRDRKKK
jgi:hypothetical protein